MGQGVQLVDKSGPAGSNSRIKTSYSNVQNGDNHDMSDSDWRQIKRQKVGLVTPIASALELLQREA